MKPHTLPVKRRPAPKGIFKRLSAVTGNRKQRVAAAASSDMEIEDGSSKISRALTIIFLIHIVAIGLIFVHQNFLDGRTPGEPKVAKASTQDGSQAAASTAQRADLPRLNKGEKSIPVRAGDNYSRIAAAEGVDEGDLRLINKHADIVPGLILKIPAKRPVAVAVAPPAVAVGEAVDKSGGLVPAVDVSEVPRARLIKPNAIHGAVAAEAPVVASGKTYVVQNGDSVWRIANRFKVNQSALMKANGITDARKIKAGMSLSIPR